MRKTMTSNTDVRSPLLAALTIVLGLASSACTSAQAPGADSGVPPDGGLVVIGDGGDAGDGGQDDAEAGIDADGGADLGPAVWGRGTGADASGTARFGSGVGSQATGSARWGR